MAIARALPEFNDLGCSVTPTFLLMDHFLYWFSTFREKMKEIYRLEVRIFGKMHHRILFLLALRTCVRRFQMPLKRLNFVKMPVTFGIIYAVDPLRSFASVDSPSIFLTKNPCRPCSIYYMGQFFKISIVFHTLYLWNEDGDPQCFLHFWHK